MITCTRLKQDFPDLKIVLNGGLTDETKIMEHLQHVDGVMIGREAYDNAYFLARIDALLFHTENPSRYEALKCIKHMSSNNWRQGSPSQYWCATCPACFIACRGPRPGANT